MLFAALATDAGIDAAIDRTVRDLVGRADLRVAAFGETGLSDATVGDDRRHARASPSRRPALEQRTYLDAATGGRRRCRRRSPSSASIPAVGRRGSTT